VSQQPFEEIVAEHGAVVRRVCRALLGPADADDAWAETFLAALRAYPDLRPGSNIRGWLVTIAHNKAIDQIRQAQRRPRPAEIPDQPVTDSLRDAPDDELRAALDALPFKQRGAVIFRYLADLSYRDIGQLLECSEPAARRNASDGIAALRTRLVKGRSR
jgi:RNA polymerase sigma factor (sigma-70 family)